MSLDPTKVKSLFSSVTFWGAVITALASAFPGTMSKFGINLSDTTVVASYMVQGFGFIVTVYGRLRATQTVTLSGK